MFACSKFADGINLPRQFAAQKRRIQKKFRDAKSECVFEFSSKPIVDFCRWTIKFLIAEMEIIVEKLSGKFWTVKELQKKIRDCLYYYRGEIETFLLQIAETW